MQEAQLLQLSPRVCSHLFTPMAIKFEHGNPHGKCFLPVRHARPKQMGPSDPKSQKFNDSISIIMLTQFDIDEICSGYANIV